MTRCDARRSSRKGHPNKHEIRLVRVGGARVASRESAIREKANVVGRWHDSRYALVTELVESGAGDEVIMSIAGHVARAMLSRDSHVRMGARRHALDEIAARQRAADQKRQKETEQRQRAAIFSGASVIARWGNVGRRPTVQFGLEPNSNPCPEHGRTGENGNLHLCA